MSTIGPWDPEVETLAEYNDRVVRTAPRPNPEQLDRLVALLRSGRARQVGVADAELAVAPGPRAVATSAGTCDA